MSSARGSRTPALEPQSPVRSNLALAVIAGGLALDVGSLNVINAALPDIGDRFHLGSGSLQWVMTSYSVTFAGFLLLGGRLTDVLGRRRIFAVGVALFAVAALVGALAPDIAVLIGARAVQGVGAALSGPAALALVGEVFPEGPQRNRAFGVYAAVGSVSASGGLVLGGVLTELLTWRSVLAVSVVAGAVILLAVRSALPAGVGRRQSLDLPGAAAVTAGLVLVVFGVSRGQETGWQGSLVITCLVLAAVSLVAFVVWERRADDPLIPMSVFGARSVQAASLTAVASYTVVVGLLFFAPLYLQQLLDYSPLLSALAILPLSGAVFVVANYLAGPLLARVGQRPMLIVGLVASAVGIASWSYTSLDGVYWTQMLPGVVLIGAGMGVAFPAMTAAGLTGVRDDQHGVAGAINVVAQQIGASIGLLLLVVVSTAAAPDTGRAGTLTGYHAAYLTAAGAAVVVAVIVLFGRRWEHRPATVGPAA